MSGRREVEACEDLALPHGQLHGMNDAAQTSGFLNEGTNAKDPEDALGGQTFFRAGCVSGNRLAMKTLQEMVARQGNLEQIDQGFKTFRRFEKQRPDR